MELDDFDAEPIEQSPPVPMTREQLEMEQTEKIQVYRRVRDLIVTPEVAQALRDGWSPREIAEVLGVHPDSVRKHIKSQEMQVLIDRESRRIINHLTKRKLQDEKYRDLALSLGVLIDKARLLRNEPTEIVQHEQGTAHQLAEIFFRRRQRAEGPDASTPVVELTPALDGSGVLGVLEQPEQEVQEPIGCDSSGGDESSGRE